MGSASPIQLVAKRQGDLRGDRPDYSVYAGEQLVGRIYQMHNERWFWGVNAVTFDMSVGSPMHGFARDLDDAKARLRAAFGRWLLWARAMPQTDLKHPHIAEELRNISLSE